VRVMTLNEFSKFFGRNIKVADDRLNEFRVESLSFVVRDCDPNTLGISEDLMASRLANLKESEGFHNADCLISRDARQTRTHRVSSRVVTLIDSGEGSVS
jgi:hypothetical protein